MIKVTIQGVEYVLEGEVWSCEGHEGHEDHENIVRILNERSASRPFHYSPRVEKSIALYIVSRFERFGAEITYDSEAGKPQKPHDPRLLD